MRFFKNLPLLHKFGLIFLLPVLTMLYFAGHLIVNSKNEYEETKDVEEFLEVITPFISFYESIQHERTQTSLFYSASSQNWSGNLQSQLESLGTCYSKTNLAADGCKRLTFKKRALFDTQYAEDIFAKSVDKLMSSFTYVDSIRNKTGQSNIQMKKDVLVAYDNIIEDTLSCIQSLLFTIDIPEFYSQFNSLLNVLYLEDEVSIELFTIADSILDSRRNAEIPVALKVMLGSQREYLTSTLLFAWDKQKKTIEQKLVSSSSAQQLKDIENKLLHIIDSALANPEQTLENWLKSHFSYKQHFKEILADIYQAWGDKADDIKSEARNRYYLVFSLLIITLIAIAGLCYLFLNLIKQSLQLSQKVCEQISSGDFTQSIRAEGRDELHNLAEFIYRSLGGQMQSMIIQIRRTNDGIVNATEELIASANRVASNAKKQSVCIEEISSVLSEASQSVDISANKSATIAQIAMETQELIKAGLESVKSNLGKMTQIKSTNAETIEGIKRLGELIASIWEIVNMINSIADQTKIIAFNAELEASAAGDAGKNFQIVATEIRRLADNTMISTNEIQSKIQEIQKSSDVLIIRAEEGANRVHEGWQSSNEVHEIFSTISDSSSTIVNSSQDVAASAQNLFRSFEKVNKTFEKVIENAKKLISNVEGNNQVVVALKGIVNRLQILCDQFKTIELEEGQIFIRWTKEYEIGIPSVDEQHKQLVRLMNDLFDAMRINDTKGIVSVLDGLVQYTDYHFNQEELLMEHNKYPELEGHAKIHDGFSSKIEKFKQGYLEGKADLSDELLEFLKKWLINHILVQDKQYVSFIKEYIE